VAICPIKYFYEGSKENPLVLQIYGIIIMRCRSFDQNLLRDLPIINKTKASIKKSLYVSDRGV
jgi:hypothetical protein